MVDKLNMRETATLVARHPQSVVQIVDEEAAGGHRTATIHHTGETPDVWDQAWISGPSDRPPVKFADAVADIRTPTGGRWRNMSPTTNLQWTQLEPGGGISPPALEGDVGFDLTVCRPYIVPPGGVTDLSVGVAVKLPQMCWAMVTGRSSAATKGLHVVTGIIDEGYTGPLFVRVVPFHDNAVEVPAGTRLGQLIVVPSRVPPLTQVDRLPGTPRGSNGFGSTG